MFLQTKSNVKICCTNLIQMIIPESMMAPECFMVYDSMSYCKLPCKNVLCQLNVIYLGITAQQDYFTHFEPSQSLDGAKMGDPLEKSHSSPELIPKSMMAPECFIMVYDSISYCKLP